MECSWGPERSGSRSVLRRCKSLLSKKVLKRRLIKGFQTKKLKKMSSKVDACLDDQSFNNAGNWRKSCDSENSIHEAKNGSSTPSYIGNA
ncbi:hypothetical protein V2J09_005782 [Rumex salicifolius]